MSQIPPYTEKTALAADDLFVIADSAASNATKKVKASTIWKTNLISAPTGNLDIRAEAGGGRVSIATQDDRIDIGSGAAINMSTLNDGDINISIDGAGVLNMNGAPTHTGTIDTAVTPNLVVVNGAIMSAS